MSKFLEPILCAMLLVTSGAFADQALNAIPLHQAGSGLPNPAAVTKPHTYVSLDPVPRGKEFQVAVVVDIATGFHMNSHKPTDAYLIPTTVTPQLPTGFKLLETIYPPGRLEKFSFSPKKPLDVYSGSVTIRLRVSAQAGAALGPAAIQATLRYQACNDTTCLPPVKVPVTAKFAVAEAGAKSRPIHSTVFQPGSFSQQR